ncbi:MAG: DNA repair protein RecO [Oscillospiraceae bacterium]|nr:DNA repair protein RecO [Oscillospiraceae bacterium]
MLITVDGLVISRREFGDSSCFIDVLTSELGVIEVTAKGVKKLNSPLSTATALFSYCTFCFNKNERNLKYTLNSAKIKLTFHELSKELEKLSLASYFAELVKFTATPEQESGKILRYLLMALYDLMRDKYTIAKIKSDFERRLAKELGFGDLGEQPEIQLLQHLERESFKSLDYYSRLNQE